MDFLNYFRILLILFYHIHIAESMPYLCPN
nr:MAG TPA: hypothetical protein [Bacteriophage sp.]